MYAFARLLCLLTLLVGTPVTAVELEETQRLAAGMEIGALEKAFANLHANVNDGKASQSEQRRAYVAFSTTDPQMHKAIAKWRDTYPQSIYAKTAELWTLYALAWHVRGSRTGQETHPDAAQEFRSMMEAAQSLATGIYSRDKRFLPASDGIFRTALVVSPTIPTDVYLLEIMENLPNYGTLYRALGLTNPRWGGSWQKLEHLCDTFAPHVPDRRGFTPLTCRITAGIDFHHDVSRIARLAGDLGEFDSETLRPWRLQDAIYLRPHRVGASELARELVEAEDFTNTRLAVAYDQRVGERNGWPRMTETVRRREFAAAQLKLKTDPYNPKLLDTLEKSFLYVLKPDAKTATAFEQDLIARRLMFDRFNPDGWAELGRLTAMPFDYENPFRAVRYYENAAAYGNHRPIYVRMVLDHWYRLMDERQRLDNAPLMTRLTKTYIAAKNSSFAERDIDSFLCPFARAYRLFNAACASNPDNSMCTLYGPQQSSYDMAFAMASDENRCAIETLNTLDALAYTPAELELPQPSTILN